MDPPPPSYEDVFPSAPTPTTNLQPFVAVVKETEEDFLESSGRKNLNEKGTSVESQEDLEDDEVFQNTLEFLKKTDIIPVPVMTEFFAQTSESQSPSTKRYQILDQETGSEVMHGMEIRSSSHDLKAFSLHLDSGKELMKCAYIYNTNFSTVEFSHPNGSPIGTFKKEGLGVGLCGCFCLCFCCPLATAALKAPNGEPLALCNSYLFPRKVDLHKPEHLGGTFMGSIDVQEMNCNSIVKTSFGDKASFNDKVFIIALAMSMMDYERVHGSRGGNPFTLTNE